MANRSVMRIPVFLSALLLACAALPAAADPHARALGESRALGHGRAWAWVEYDRNKHPTAVGFGFTESALSGLPQDGEMGSTYEYPLALPRKIAVPPYTHLVLNWNPHGHVPKGVYDVPHFDFHFYLIGQAEREKITCRDLDEESCGRKPPSACIPDGYFLPPGSDAPRIGVHWVSLSFPELHREPFTHSFIYGTYDGQVAFIEPMISKSYLESRPEMSVAVEQPAKFQLPGYYPSAYSIKYDPARREYSVALEGLVRH